MIASYLSPNPRAAWIKRDDFVRRPHRWRRDEASPDGYDQQEASRHVKRIKIDAQHYRHQRNISAATNVSTQAINSPPTSPAFPASSPQASPSVSLPTGTPAAPWVAVTSPPPSPPLPSPPTSTSTTSTVSETSDPEQRPVLEDPALLPADNPADATSDLLAILSTFTSTSSSSTISSSSPIARPTTQLRAPMSGPPQRNNIIEGAGEGPGLTTPAAAAAASTTTTSSSSSSTRSIRNKAVDDSETAPAVALAANDGTDPTAAPVVLDAAATTESGVLLDTGADPSAPSGQSFVAGDGFSAITLLPGESASPTSSSSSSSSRTKTKTKCSSTTLGVKGAPTPASGTIQGNAADSSPSASAASAEDHSKEKGIIAGSIVGAAAAVALLFILLFFCYKRRKARNSLPNSPSASAIPKRRSPYGRFSVRNMTSSLRSLPSLSSLPSITMFGKGTKSPPNSMSEQGSKPFSYFRGRSSSSDTSINEKKPRAASYSGLRSPPSSLPSRRSSSFTAAEPFLPMQSSTEGTLDLAPAFRTLSPVVESPRTVPVARSLDESAAAVRPPIAPLRNPFESPRKAHHETKGSKSSFDQRSPPSPTASSVSNMLASPTSFHTRSSGVLLPEERARASSSSSSARTISLPPAYPQHSRSASEPEPAPIEPIGPWRDSMWSVGLTPVGNTPRGSSGWGGMGWFGSRGSGANGANSYGGQGGYGNNGGFANHRASKSSSHYTENSESNEWPAALAPAPAPLFQPSSMAGQGQSRSQPHIANMQQIPSVPRIPDGMQNARTSNSAGASAALRAAHQRKPAVRAIPSAYIGGPRHIRRKSSVGAPNWEGERRESDESSNGGNGNGSAGQSSNGNSSRSGQSSLAASSGKSGRASENSVATVFRIHPGTPVKF